MASAATLAAIEAAVVVRIPAAQLKNITRAVPTTTDTPSATVLTAGVADCCAELEEALGVTLDSSSTTNPIYYAVHIRLGVKGTLLILKEYKQLSMDLDSSWDSWLKSVEARSRLVSGGNRRLSPVTSTGQRPTTPLYAELLEIDLPTRANIPGGPTWPSS